MSEKSAAEFIPQHEEALNKFLALENDKDWNFSKEEDGIKIYLRTDPSSPNTQVKSEITLDVPVEKVISVMDPMPTIDSTNAESVVKARKLFGELNDENLTSFMYVVIQPGPRFITPRDFIMLRRKYQKDGKTIYLHVSVPDEISPPDKNHVRGHMMFQGYIVQADPEKEGSTKVTFMVHSDPGGSIPTMLNNAMVGKQGLCLRKVRQDALAN